MRRLLLTLSAFALIGSASMAQAAVQSCVTINGQETCATAERSLACQTIDGRTVCVSGDGNVVINRRYHRSEQVIAPGTPDPSSVGRPLVPMPDIQIPDNNEDGEDD